MKFAGLLVTTLLLGQSVPAFAQYHYSYGNSKVTNQNQTGLYHPSGTYIGCGTMSQSAQGKAAGVGSGLPSVNMGSHVRTPGDNIYNGDGTDRMYNGAMIYKDQEAALFNKGKARRSAAYRRMMAQQAMQNQQRTQGYAYVPGSNGAAATYSSGPQAQMNFSRSGAATYGAGGYSGRPSTRGF
jgi:hypothetical protein